MCAAAGGFEGAPWLWGTRAGTGSLELLAWALTCGGRWPRWGTGETGSLELLACVLTCGGRWPR